MAAKNRGHEGAESLPPRNSPIPLGQWDQTVGRTRLIAARGLGTVLCESPRSLEMTSQKVAATSTTGHTYDHGGQAYKKRGARTFKSQDPLSLATLRQVIPANTKNSLALRI